MEMQELEITIDNEGKVKVRVQGVHGSDCTSVTKTLEDALGEVSERSYLPEYYEEVHQHSPIRNNLRK